MKKLFFFNFTKVAKANDFVLHSVAEIKLFAKHFPLKRSIHHIIVPTSRLILFIIVIIIFCFNLIEFS